MKNLLIVYELLILGARGIYDASDENFIAKLNEEHKSRAIKLDVTEFKQANDFYTAEEMVKN